MKRLLLKLLSEVTWSDILSILELLVPSLYNLEGTQEYILNSCIITVYWNITDDRAMILSQHS